jgi:hypothetical protein
LLNLGAQLRSEASVVSPHVVDSVAEPALGMLAAAGPRAAPARAEYALIVESVREGYLLHYGEPRIVIGADRDLRLLAGDYLYALGLERLAALGDLEAVRELSDLISLAARIHDREGPAAAVASEASALWLAAAAAIAGGASDAHEQAKRALREGGSDSAALLRSAAEDTAADGGFTQALGEASAGLDFRSRVG